MTRLEHITIEGFKGIERLEFDPGQFTVVTGRNNSGKTSLLEAVDLALQPTHISRFDPNLDVVINHRYEECEISVVANSTTREVRLRNPTAKMVPEYLVEGFRTELLDVWNSFESGEIPKDEVKELLDRNLPQMVNELVTERDLHEVMDEIIIIRIDGVDYPFVSFGTTISDLYSSVREDVNELYKDDIVSALSNKDTIKRQSKILLAHSFTGPQSGRFIEEEPSPFLECNLIDFMQLSETLELSTNNGDPIRIDNIGDFIKEKGIVEDLKSFNFDYLVFEDEDGHKKSIPFDFMGEGFKTIVGVLWELMGEDQSWDVVLLEEPETHLHPGYVRELIYFLIQISREDDMQLFITTHNNDFLNDFFSENLTDHEEKFLEAEFQLLQLEEGTVDVMTYEDAESHLKELKLDLRGL